MILIFLFPRYFHRNLGQTIDQLPYEYNVPDVIARVETFLGMGRNSAVYDEIVSDVWQCRQWGECGDVAETNFGDKAEILNIQKAGNV